MKRTLTAMACALTLLLSASTTQALTIGGDGYLGSIAPGTPSNPANEVEYINQLIGMSPSPPSVTIGGNTFTRSDFDCTGGACPAATAVGSVKNDPPTGAGSVDVSAFTYLYAKYGGDAHVWVVTGLAEGTTVSVPTSNLGGQGLSHYSRYNPGTVTVPDGGATLGLLGLAMLGVGYLRSRMT